MISSSQVVSKILNSEELAELSGEVTSAYEMAKKLSTPTEEEINYLVNNELDIYSKSGYWDYCFVISDSNSDGTVQHSTLLEFSAIGDLGLILNKYSK